MVYGHRRAGIAYGVNLSSEHLLNQQQHTNSCFDDIKRDANPDDGKYGRLLYHGMEFAVELTSAFALDSCVENNNTEITSFSHRAIYITTNQQMLFNTLEYQSEFSMKFFDDLVAKHFP